MILLKLPFSLSDAALQGLPGEIVKRVAPFTEADPAALLVQTLSFFGCAIGCKPHFMIGRDYHALKVYPTIVGATSKARKGSSSSIIRSIFEAADSTIRPRIRTGVSSGEGIIHAVRDASRREKNITRNGKVQNVVEEDCGVGDKRLLIYEPEFARLLKVSWRQGSTRSPVIRDCYDSTTLQIANKNTPETATDVQVVIIAHITMRELLRDLNEIEMQNGFANRFIWMFVHRRQHLPLGPKIPDKIIDELGAKVSTRLFSASRVGEMMRSKRATTLWVKEYDRLEEDGDSLVDAVLARAAAQVVRLACIYALMDDSRTVLERHLRAALALWQYSEDSVHHIFDDGSDDWLADRIVKCLESHPGGQSTTDFHRMTNNNIPGDRIQATLAKLISENRIASTHRPSTGGGKPTTIWTLNQAEVKELGSLDS